MEFITSVIETTVLDKIYKSPMFQKCIKKTSDKNYKLNDRFIFLINPVEDRSTAYSPIVRKRHLYPYLYFSERLQEFSLAPMR